MSKVAADIEAAVIVVGVEIQYFLAEIEPYIEVGFQLSVFERNVDHPGRHIVSEDPFPRAVIDRIMAAVVAVVQEIAAVVELAPVVEFSVVHSEMTEQPGIELLRHLPRN